MATYTYPTNLYQGWDPASAQADFNATGGKNKAGYVAPNNTNNTTSQPSGGYSAPNYQDVTKTAQQLHDFQVQANQPAISTLQSGIGDLGKRYSDLVDSIKGAGSVALNTATSQGAAALGARGLLPSSELGQTELKNAQLPVTAGIQSALAGAGVSQTESTNNILNAIASLQAGNPGGDITAASNLLASNFQQIPNGASLFNVSNGQTTTPSSFQPTLSTGNASIPSTNSTGNSSGLSSQRTPLTNLSSQFGLGGATGGALAPTTTSSGQSNSNSSSSSNPLSWLFGTTPSLLGNLFK